MLEIQKLALQKSVTPTPEELKALADSEELFLSNQKQYQILNEDIARLNVESQDLDDEQRGIERTLDESRDPVQREFGTLERRHELKVAAVKLGALTPLLAIAFVLFVKKRGTLYAPLIYAFGIALLAKVILVMHEYFPERYFKYVLILACLVVIVRILVYLLKMIAYPKREWLLKQYREAYEAFLCPVCDYPIRRGPLKYLVWSRRSIRKLHVPLVSPETEESYTCPMCGTALYEECSVCHAIRHSLLPACENCGAEKAPSATPAKTKDGK